MRTWLPRVLADGWEDAGQMPPTDPRIQTAKTLHADKKMPIADICRTLKISRPTLYRYLARN